jgi:peptide chain release factor 1
MIPAAKLMRLVDRFQQVEAQLASGTGGSAYVKLSKEHAELAPVVGAIESYRQVSRELEEAEALAADPTAESDMRAMAEQERSALKERFATLERELQLQLLPKDSADSSSAIVEIRAGTGGDEAALFAADLLEMYQRYAQLQGWKTELMDRSDSDLGGIKDAVLEVVGAGAYAKLKFESGVHRVQRVPVTEASGRIHTSAATVAVLPEAEDVDIEINDKDLRIDVYRAQGAGGQHVNKTESAVRITHLPTNIVVQCQSDRSQHKNRAQAWSMLRARIYEAEMRRREDAAAAENALKSDIGWGHQIRSYVLQPYQLVKDLRTGLESHAPGDVLDGALDPFMAASLAQRIGGDEAGEIADIE